MSKLQKKPSVKKPSIKPAKGKKAEEVVKIAKPETVKSGRRDSKQNTLITLLKRPAGATVEEMAKATGWQNHSVHGVRTEEAPRPCHYLRQGEARSRVPHRWCPLMKHRYLDKGSLARELARLYHLDRPGLIKYWSKLYDTAPPKQMSNKFLVHALAYKLQEKTLGGLRPATKRTLETVAKDGRNHKQHQPSNLRPGTRLLREWHGFTYEATVLEDGVLFQGKQYRSLTEVASIITGVHWSGPKFFGLKSKKVMS